MTINKKIVTLAGLASMVFLALQLLAPVNAYAGTACVSYATNKCVSNISYWYDSCGNIQSVKQNCNLSNQACSGGMCVNQTTTPAPTPTPATTGGSYIQNYRTYCYNGNVQWYDSRGAVQSVYQTCQDTNSCTIDSCADNACKTQLRCDGSTCAVNSADYMTHCANNLQGSTTTNNTTTNNTTTNNTTTVNQSGQVAGITTQNRNFAISLLGKKQSAETQWAKAVDASNAEVIEFLMVVKNISGAPMQSVIVMADLTQSIAYTGNLKIDGLASAGSVTQGIDLGAFPAEATKSIYFTATVQTANTQMIQVVARATANGASDSDMFTVNAGSTAVASVSDSSNSTSSPFLDFIKKWYLWIIIVIVLIAIFVIIFRRLSTNP